MNILLTLVRVRMYQLRRYAAGLGPLYCTAAFLGVGAASCVSYFLYLSLFRGLLSISVILMLTLMIQTRRSDNQFIFHMIRKPGWNIFTEYFLFSLPFTGPALFTKNWFLFPAVTLGQLVISQLRVVAVQRTMFPGLSRILPPAYFEWISGIRRNALSMGSIFVIGLLISPAKFLPLVVLWVLTAFVASFFQECEPLNMLTATFVNPPSRFLRSRLARHSALLVAFFLPVIAVNGWFNPELIWLSLIFVVLQVTVLWFAILLKYARYEPRQRLAGNSIPVAFASLSTVLPFLLPVSLFMSLRYFRIGAHNLGTYVHD